MKKTFGVFVFILLMLVIGTSVYFYFRYKFADGELAQALSRSEKLDLPSGKISPSAANSAAIRVPILVYHSVRPYYPGESKFQKIFDVEPDHFAAQLRYLKLRGYSVVTFDDLANYFSGTPLPAKPVIISFDDGWENQYTYALPLLQKENLVATFFIYSHVIGHRKFMAWDEVQALSRAGMIIGGHSKTHPYLWKITDPARLRSEIVDSKKIIEGHIGKPVTVFAYPFGRYSTSTIATVKAAGYRSARSGYEGVYHTKEELYTLRSIQVSDNLKRFAAMLNLKR